MSADSRQFLVQDLCLVKGGRRLPKGSNLSVQKNNHPYIRTKDIKDGVIDTSEIEYVPDSVFPLVSRYTVDKGDLIISIVGTIGNCAVTPDILDKASLTENCAKLINLDSSRLDIFFLYYFFSSPSGQALINERVVGSTQPKLPLYGIESIPVALPSIDEQQKIAHILGTLDNKIKLNRNTNETLEGIAKAVFKSWFLDFDPVRARAEGRPTGLPNDVAKLFPDSFEASELGDIPKGWEISPLSDFIAEKGKKTKPSPETFKNPYVPIDCISSKSLALQNHKHGDEAKSSLVSFKKGISCLALCVLISIKFVSPRLTERLEALAWF